MDNLERRRLITEFSMYAALYMAAFLILRFWCFNSIHISLVLGHLGIAMFFFTPFVMYFLIKRYGKGLEEYMSFGTIVRMTFQTFCMASMFLVFFACFYYIKINPNLLSEAYATTVEVLSQSDPNVAEMLATSGKASISPIMVSLQQIFWKMLEGLFCGLILGLVYKRQNRSVKKEE